MPFCGQRLGPGKTVDIALPVDIGSCAGEEPCWLPVDIDRFGIGSLGPGGVESLTVEGVRVVLEATEGLNEESLFAGGSKLCSSRLRLRDQSFRSTSGIAEAGEGMFGARYGGIDSGWGSAGCPEDEFVMKGGEVLCDTGGEGRCGCPLNWGVGRVILRVTFSFRNLDALS